MQGTALYIKMLLSLGWNWLFSWMLNNNSQLKKQVGLFEEKDIISLHKVPCWEFIQVIVVFGTQFWCPECRARSGIAPFSYLKKEPREWGVTVR